MTGRHHLLLRLKVSVFYWLLEAVVSREVKLCRTRRCVEVTVDAEMWVGVKLKWADLSG